MYCTLSEKWRAQATISTVFVRTAPVLSCLWGLQILAVSIFGQSCHHALHQTIPKLPINSYYTKLWQDTLYILKSRSKPLSWMFLIGTHQPKHTHTNHHENLSNLDSTYTGKFRPQLHWLVCWIHFEPFWTVDPGDAKAMVMQNTSPEKTAENWCIQLMTRIFIFCCGLVDS